MRLFVIALVLLLMGCGAPRLSGPPPNIKTPFGPPGSFGNPGLDPNDETIVFEVQTKDEAAAAKFLTDHGVAYRFDHHDDRTEVIVKIGIQRQVRDLTSEPGRSFDIYTGGRHGKKPMDGPP